MIVDHTEGGGLVPPDPFAGLEIPEVLHESMRRHQENLVRLIRSLQSAGLSEAEIEVSVSVIVASYRSELIHALKSIAR